MMNISVADGVGALPVNTQLLCMCILISTCSGCFGYSAIPAFKV